LLFIGAWYIKKSEQLKTYYGSAIKITTIRFMLYRLPGIYCNERIFEEINLVMTAQLVELISQTY